MRVAWRFVDCLHPLGVLCGNIKFNALIILNSGVEIF